MTNRKLVALAGALLVGLAACEAEQTPEGDIEPVAEPTPEAPIEEPAPPMTAGAEVSVAQTGELGPYLTDARGRALYLLEEDGEGETTCVDDCAEAWPPLLASDGAPAAAHSSIRPDLLGTLTRPDGTTQVTYGGHALYYYAQDQGPAQTTGQDVTDQWGEWYLVTPEGEPLEGHDEEDTAQP